MANSSPGILGVGPGEWEHCRCCDITCGWSGCKVSCKMLGKDDRHWGNSQTVVAVSLLPFFSWNSIVCGQANVSLFKLEVGRKCNSLVFRTKFDHFCHFQKFLLSFSKALSLKCYTHDSDCCTKWQGWHIRFLKWMVGWLVHMCPPTHIATATLRWVT